MARPRNYFQVARYALVASDAIDEHTLLEIALKQDFTDTTHWTNINDLMTENIQHYAAIYAIVHALYTQQEQH